jgi:ribonucleotide reductase alpha subunit
METYVSTDIEADGPIPGGNSMLSVGSAAYTAAKELLGTFMANLETLPAAVADPKTDNLLAIASTGTISLLAGNLGSGIEPIFGIETIRNVPDAEGKQQQLQVTDYAYAQRPALQKGPARLPDYFIHQDAIPPEDHLLMQAALQPYVDGAISKTIRLPESSFRASVPAVLESAHSLRVKGVRSSGKARAPA